ncbi:ATPase [Nonomuraea sp. MG754425]|uniref:RapZ C-terminal domain-containing protein n=1 Tax=Nonomuraea sp. MG754425 TaxID=2570319 RepID=UPI001F1A909C|nr:RNase adapter RapZ [Nonomuraea sp. MG754425]MCF6467434.1 ATPase [Nonomuraea sp. MG754425]
MIEVISFGFGHEPPPRADLLIDVRDVLRNPHDHPALREMTGMDEPVRRHVLDTPGALRLLHHVVATASALAADLAPQNRTVTVAWGCSGGRHRAVALAEETFALLWASGADVVSVSHRDVGKSLLVPQGRQS